MRLLRIESQRPLFGAKRGVKRRGGPMFYTESGMSESAYQAYNEQRPARLLFLCDHASKAVPPELDLLGLSEGDFARHIAYDIGAAELTRALADLWAAPALLARWSRLVVDLNRGEDDPTVVMKLSDGRVIPGNRDLDRKGVEDRIARFHTPYHAAIAAKIRDAAASGDVPILVSMHSFTPEWRGQKRPWHVGVLWDKDGRLALPLLERLRRESDIIVGDNEPYSGELENDTLYRHGTMNGLPHVLIEVRQDLIADRKGVERWAKRLKQLLDDALRAMGKPTIRFTRPLAASFGGLQMDEKTRTELEAAAFRRLVEHLRNRTDVQNIDMMNLAGFCRNCLGDWYREAAAQKGITLEKDAAREIVYGMPPAEWKKRYQKEASAEAQAAFSASHKTHS
jgi:predicted N-formylglutamate amidohydrolase